MDGGVSCESVSDSSSGNGAGGFSLCGLSQRSSSSSLFDDTLTSCKIIDLLLTHVPSSLLFMDFIHVSVLVNKSFSIQNA